MEQGADRAVLEAHYFLESVSAGIVVRHYKQGYERQQYEEDLKGYTHHIIHHPVL